MRYRVLLTASAERDIETVLAWFRDQRATTAGGRWLRELLQHVATLEERPERCAIAIEGEELGREIRELLFGKRQGKYRILFEIRGRRVVILRLWHGARSGPSSADLELPQ